MRTLLLAGFAMVLVACGDDSGTEPAEVNLSGTWTFSVSYSHAQMPISCQATGSVTILQQSGAVLTGHGMQTGTCEALGIEVDISTPITIANGEVDGDDVSFTAAECVYTGSLSRNRNELSGTAICTRTFASQTATLSGTWQASRSESRWN